MISIENFYKEKNVNRHLNNRMFILFRINQKSLDHFFSSNYQIIKNIFFSSILELIYLGIRFDHPFQIRERFIYY